MKYITHNEKETENVGAQLAKTLKRGDIVAFYGDLGAGKTTFVRGIASVLSPSAYVQSPTFTVMIEYDSEIPLYHFDMYRIDGYEELYGIGFFDYAGGDGIALIEWSENIENELPRSIVKVDIRKGEGENEREITITDMRGGENENSCI